MPRPTSYNRDIALTSAMTLFWEKGFHATSLKDLEAALKMKPGSIYAAFSNKETLYSKAMQCYFESAREAFRSEIAGVVSPLEGLAGHIESYAVLSKNHPQRQVCMLLKTIIDTQTTDPALASQARKYLDEIRSEIAIVFERARSIGELPADADTVRLARRFQTNLNALRVELHQGIDAKELGELVEDMAQEIRRLSVVC